MGIQLELPDDLYKRIESHAAVVDLTPVSVIERWANHFEARAREKVEKTVLAETSEASCEKLNASTPPDLLHTRVRGMFGDTPFKKWNDLLRIAHRRAFAKAKAFEELRTVTHAQIREGNHDGDSGYQFLPDIGISVQGVDANHAWTYSLRLAQYSRLAVKAYVMWRHNPKAARPGESAVLEWSP